MKIEVKRIILNASNYLDIMQQIDYLLPPWNAWLKIEFESVPKNASQVLVNIYYVEEA